MRLYRLFATLRSGLAAILAVAVIAGGALVSAAPSNPAPALSLIPRLSTSYHPSFPNTSTYQSALYVQNPGAADAVVVLTFYSATLAPFSLSTAIPAGATLSYARGEVPGLAAGAWWLEIVSDQELASVVEVYGPAGDRLAAYRGMTAPTASSQAAPAEKMYLSVFSPFFDSGGLTLWNVSTWNAAEVVIDLYQPDGSIQMSFPRTIPAGGVVSLYGPSAGVPAGCYTAVVSSTAPLVGLLNVRTAGTAPSVFELRAPLPTPATMAVLPRAQKQVDEGGGPRTSTLYLTNHGSAAGAFAVAFYGTDHALVTTVPVSSLPAFGMKEVDLATLSNLPSGTYSVEASGDQPVTLSEVTSYPTPPADHHVATYSGQAAVRQSLPCLAKTAEAYAIFSVQNPNAEAANVVIEYFDLAGQMVYNYALTLASGGWQRHDLRGISSLPAGFTGSAVVLSDFPVGLLVDDFYTPCVQPSGGQISRVPSGDLFPGDSVQFTANASGTGPFSYTWTVDAQPAGSDSATLDHTFQAPGPHAVGVTVTNACGQTTASLEVNVLEPPAPDLSTSSKTASQSAVDAGDTVTYTLILRNTGPLAASAVLTDPIPLYTDYVAGSAQASDRSPVTVAGGELHWAGQVISGTVVVIQYAVQIQSAPAGTAIVNTASLSDGAGHVTALQANAIFNPGYRLTINEGAIFTNTPTVTLRFGWNTDDGITAYQVSNDGGFTPGSGTTGWLPVNPANPTHPGWELAAYGDLRLPQTVYIRFQNAGGTPFGPFQEDIILDPVPPQVDSLELMPIGGAAAVLRPTAGKSVLVRVIASDDNSGVREVQLSNRSDFAVASSYPVAGSLTEIAWPLQPSGFVYARVLDRAGNPSLAASAQGEPWYPVYLPILQRSAP